MRHRRPLIRHLTAAGAVALVAGSALLAPALRWLEREGPRPVWLGVGSGNPGAQRLYERHGFSRVGEYAFMVGSHADHELIYRRPPL